MRAAKATRIGWNGTTVSARRELVALFENQFDTIYRFSLARTGDPATADDVAAEVFLAAARAFAEGRGENVDLPWLVVTARRRIVDQWRSRERQRRRVERLLSMTPDLERGEDVEGIQSDVTEQVLVAMNAISERQRSVIALRYLEERSVGEIAEHLDLSYQATESLLARARRSFIVAWEEGHG